jgi:hypothetical protein
VGACLLWGSPAGSLYARGSFGAGEPLYGLSDLDLAIVLAGDPRRPGRARDRVRRRWRRLGRALPALRPMIDMAVYEERDLAVAAAAPTPTARRAVHYGAGQVADDASLLVRPGLYGALWDWRGLAGRPRLPDQPALDAQDRRIAGWLELQFWWRYAFGLGIDPTAPRAAYLCVKLVSEPARIWLWLVHGERVEGRAETLRRALEVLPDEEEALRAALALHSLLDRSPPAPVSETLPTLVRLSSRLARRLAADVEPAGATEVRLAWGGQDELIVPGGAGREHSLLPLADWRALARPLPLDESFALLPLDPASPADLGATAGAHSVPYPALRAGELLVMPTTRGGHLRSVQCRTTDPVSFALADGAARAAFPEVRGWSAGDWARRAVAEHRAWLGLGEPGEPPALRELMRGQARTVAPRPLTLSRLLTAARAALFLDSLERGEPVLALTAAAVADRLGADDVLAWHRACREEGGDPPARVVGAFRETVLALPAYRPAGWWTAATPARIPA